jgi:ferritin-like metal-binding protein YciE
MNDDQKKMYVAWLNDAHAMELGLVRTLEAQIAQTNDKPDIQAKLKEHLEETKGHAEKVEACLKRHGGDPSLGKDWLAQLSALAGGMAAALPHDALIKNLHTSYASEHFEIATYTLIAAAAKALGDDETAAVCQDILVDEADMQAWLLETLGPAAVEHLETMK